MKISCVRSSKNGRFWPLQRTLISYDWFLPLSHEKIAGTWVEPGHQNGTTESAVFYWISLLKSSHFDVPALTMSRLSFHISGLPGKRYGWRDCIFGDNGKRMRYWIRFYKEPMAKVTTKVIKTKSNKK